MKPDNRVYKKLGEKGNKTADMWISPALLYEICYIKSGRTLFGDNALAVENVLLVWINSLEFHYGLSLEAISYF